MAVQAQHHSSNLIFLNRNRKEEEQLVQTNMLFNNEGSNERQRQLPLQPQFPQVIDLSLLHNYNHPPSVYTGLRLSSGEDQTQKINTLFHHQRSLVPTSSQDVVNLQSEELDVLLHAQAEELKRTLAEKRKMHYKALIGAVEETFVRKLREKDAEIEKATRLHDELEARDKQLRAEAQAWRARVSAQEATAASLQASSSRQLTYVVAVCGGKIVELRRKKGYCAAD